MLQIMVEQLVDPILGPLPPPGIIVRVPCNSVVVILMMCLVMSSRELRSPRVPACMQMQAQPNP